MFLSYVYTDFSNDNVMNSSYKAITAVLPKNLLLIKLINFHINMSEGTINSGKSNLALIPYLQP